MQFEVVHILKQDDLAKLLCVLCGEDRDRGRDYLQTNKQIMIAVSGDDVFFQ